MNIEDFKLLNTEERIRHTIGCDSVAWREMKLRWFYIVKKVDDFFVELKYDEFRKERVAVGARAIPACLYYHLVEHNYYGICRDYFPDSL